VLLVIDYLLDMELIKFNSDSIQRFSDKNLHDLNFVMVTLTRKIKMIKSPVQMYKNGHNWSMLMYRILGIETSILRRSTCVLYSYNVKTLLS